MDDLRKFVIPEFVFGIGASRLAGQYASNLGCTRVLLVTDTGVQKAGWVRPVRESLGAAGLEVAVYADVSPNPRDNEVEIGVSKYHETGADGIVAVGGGSPIDCAKAIAILSANGGGIREYAGVDRIVKPMPPLVCIPTTAGTSADVSQFAIITDTRDKVKLAIVSKAVIPDVALIDPETTITMDASLTAATGVDALVHAFEAYVSLGSWTMTDLHAERAVSLVWKALESCVHEPENLAMRTAQMQASLHAGLAFSNASLGLVHAMAHSLGGELDLPHGLCNALLLPEVVEYNSVKAGPKYERLMQLLGFSAYSGRTIRQQLKEFLETVGITESLGLSAQPESVLHKLAEKALADACVFTNPVSPSIQDIKEIYARI